MNRSPGIVTFQYVNTVTWSFSRPINDSNEKVVSSKVAKHTSPSDYATENI